MSYYFDITPEDLGRLTAREAVAIFRDLIFAEAKQVGGIEIGHIDIPSSNTAITTCDGGIDGQVTNANPKHEGHGIIKQGLTCYQIKTGKADIRTVHDAKDIISTKAGICSRVKSCIENGGTFVVVLFGSDAPDREQEQSIRCLQESIAEFMPEHADYPNVEIWRQSNLVGFLQDFPSLCMAVKKQSPTNLMSIQSWAQLLAMHHNLSLGENQRNVISAIREAVLGKSSAAIRVLGEAGVGKTRLVLEALNIDECKGTVLYAGKPSALPPGFLNSLVMADSTARCILVVDECDAGRHGEIWNWIASASDRIQLVTIFNDEETSYDGKMVVRIQPLDQKEIAEIIGSYGIPDFRSNELAAFCSGSPRVAHILGEQMSRSGDLDISYKNDVWVRCIAGADDTSSENARKRLCVMKWLALFRRFGYTGPYREEGNLVVSMIERSTGLTACEIREIISYLRKKKLLQGDHTLYITPRLMHIWLWTKWWEEQGHGFDFDNFIHVDDEKELNDKLIDWFFDMMQYGRESTIVPQIIDGFFSNHGPFSTPAFLRSNSGERLLDILANIAPRKTLVFIEGILAGYSEDDLLHLREGRRGIIDALQRVARETQLFERAAQLLLRLAYAENEHYTNNATGVFAGLFSNGIGPLAPTAASPEIRFPILERIAMSEQQEAQAIAIKAISEGLEQVTHTMTAFNEADVLHERIDGWLPTSYDEWWDAYRRIWALGVRCLYFYEGDNRHELANILVQRCIHLVEFIGDGTEAVEWLETLVDTGYAEKEAVVKGVSGLLKRSQYTSATAKQALVKLQEKLVGTDYESQMERYVGMNVWDDEFDETGFQENRLEAKLQELAQKSIANPDKLAAMLPWLITDKPARSGRFGYALGVADEHNTQWEAIFEAVRAHEGGDKADPRLCSGYLRSTFNDNPKLWEERIQRLSQESKLRELVPAIACNSGMTDCVFADIVDMYEADLITTRSLLPVRFGGVLAKVSRENVYRLLNVLLKKQESAASMLAVDLAHMYKHDGGIITGEMAIRLVTQESLLDDEWVDETSSYMSSWCEECIDILDSEPNYAYDITAYTAKAISVGARLEPYCIQGVFKKAASVNPASTWNAVAPYFDAGDYNVMARFGSMFQESGEKPLDTLPTATVMEWIRENPESRAIAIARVTAATLRNDHGDPLLARELIAACGDNDRVRQALFARFGTYSWTGNQSSTIERKIEELRSYKQSETNTRVLRWIEDAIDMFECEMDKAHAREERDW